MRRWLVGPPRSLRDRSLFHKVSLVAVLAWVGLGADGLSSSAYGPEEAFRTLGEHTYLATLLAVLMATTVLVISAGYSRNIEKFPHGGGYVVATSLLGERVGLASGCALLVDYVLTITVSIAAAGDALFSFLPPPWHACATLFTFGSVLCAVILVTTVYEKFTDGGWITLMVTGALVGVCFLIRAHYRNVTRALTRAFSELEGFAPEPVPAPGEPDPSQPTAAILVTAYGGLGVHTTLNVFRAFPGHFKNVIFLSVGVIDSAGFKGEDSVERLEKQTREMLSRYVELARRMGVPAASRMAIGTDAVETAENLCLRVAEEFPSVTFFAGQVVFKRDTSFRRLLHNQTAYAIQRRLQWAERNMVILPARIA